MRTTRTTRTTRTRGAREVEQWLARNIAWPSVLTLAMLSFTVAVVRESAAGQVLAPAIDHLAAAAGAMPVASGPPPSIQAAAAIVMDGDTGAVLYSMHADDMRPMASCTKIMTALVAVQHGTLDQMVTIGTDAASYVNSYNSYMGLSAGEKVSLADLLYGLLLPSGNDAAIAIADAIGGSQDQFVSMMNQEAQTLGLTHTHFADPHGLDAPGHHTSARDLGVLSIAALHNPTIARIAATLHYEIPQTATHKAYSLFNYNSLLPGAHSPYPGAIGLKPGNTGAAGWCEAFAARRNDHLIVGVVLGDPTWSQRNTDMHALLDWGFSQVGVT
jgi:serine-type D-Ala-D-Ala carboxypeptidase (penicillin-binding protein 5/6)